MNFNLLASVLRTVVPVIAGALLTLTGAVGINVDSTQAAIVVTALVTAAYYLVFRLAEQAAARLRWAWLRRAAGVLLGWARPPQYTPQQHIDVTLDVDWSKVGEDLFTSLQRNIGARGTAAFGDDRTDPPAPRAGA
ncbi:hypothetical protein ACFWZY_01475 [Streptomyces sp. NPDC058992]|uniref:hypothetical protein n=1 Tax=Streptomyces sp. NPDC058992 TaxID=3346688 RepID=UPI00367D9EC4